MKQCFFLDMSENMSSEKMLWYLVELCSCQSVTKKEHDFMALTLQAICR